MSERVTASEINKSQALIFSAVDKEYDYRIIDVGSARISDRRAFDAIS